VRYDVRLSIAAERDVDRTLRWFHEQKATDAGTRWFAGLMARIDTLENIPSGAGSPRKRPIWELT
jgi:hypothetical protein